MPIVSFELLVRAMNMMSKICIACIMVCILTFPYWNSTEAQEQSDHALAAPIVTPLRLKDFPSEELPPGLDNCRVYALQCGTRLLAEFAIDDDGRPLFLIVRDPVRKRRVSIEKQGSDFPGVVRTGIGELQGSVLSAYEFVDEDLDGVPDKKYDFIKNECSDANRIDWDNPKPLKHCVDRHSPNNGS